MYRSYPLLLILTTCHSISNLRNFNTNTQPSSINTPDHCIDIHSIQDCNCGKKPCNYCINCPCYGCLSETTYNEAQSRDPAHNPIQLSTVKYGQEHGAMNELLDKSGGSFVDPNLIDDELRSDIDKCELLEEQCKQLLELFVLTNKHRSELFGKPGELESNLILNDVAQRHSCFMATIRTLKHSATDDREFPESDKKLTNHVTRAGYRWLHVGENVAAGQFTAEEVLKAWIGSPEHREILEKKDFTALGIGLAKGPKRNYWTMVFGEPKNKGFGGDGPTEQHESTTDTAGRFDKCNRFVEEGIIAPLEINHDRIAHIDTAN